MPSNIGNQSIYVKYFDPVDSPIVNHIGLGVRKVGLYSGGYLTILSDVSVSLSTFTCEISDGTYQIWGTTGSVVTPITVSTAAPYVVLRWIYTGSASVDYIDFVATATPLTNDIIVGKCIYAGASLTGINYSERTNPNIMDLVLKVEPTETASMRVRVRAGHLNYGSANYDIVDQTTSLISAPGAGSRIDLVQINTSGTVIVTTGVAAGSPTVPNYGNLVTLAELTIASTSTSITASMIKDVRSFIGFSPAASGFVDLVSNQTVGGIKTFTSFPVTPSAAPTTNYQVANKKYVDDSQLVSYDSGWFAIIIGTAYTKTHNLGTTKLLVSMYVSENSDGSGISVNPSSLVVGTDGNQGINVTSLSTTTISVRTGSYYLVSVLKADGSYWIPTSGYMRIIILALT